MKRFAEIDGVSVQEEKIVVDQSKFKMLHLGRESNEVGDVTEIKCDTIEVAQFLFAACVQDYSSVPDTNQFSILYTRDFGLKECGEPIWEPGGGEPLVFLPREEQDCKEGPAVFIRVYRYTEWVSDYLLLPANKEFSLDTDDENVALLYSLAVAGECDREVVENTDGQVKLAIACAHCDSYTFADYDHCSLLPASLIESFTEDYVDDDVLRDLLMKAIESLRSNHPNLRETISILEETAEQLSLFDDDDFAEEFAAVLEALN